jgi:histidinol-phosphatase
MSQLSEFKAVALEAVSKSEERIMHYFHNLPPIEKKIDMSPVTKADKEAEEIIIDTIKKRFPSHGFLGEEYGSDHDDAEFVWIIDPIDGTKNFIHGIDFFGTVLGLKHQGTIVLGISNMPAVKELLFASTEEQTTANGKAVHVSSIADMKEASVTCGSFGKPENELYRKAIFEIADKTYHMKGYGDVHGYHLVATGKADAMFENSVKAWDISAYQIIIKQAGGRYSDFSGNDFALGGTSIATNGLFHDQMLAVLKEAQTNS